MFGNTASPTLISRQLQVQAQSYLDQACLQKEAQHFEMALALYDQAKVTFRHAAAAHQLVPLSELKSAVAKAHTPQTSEEDSLRQRIAEVYFERGKLFEKLKKPRQSAGELCQSESMGASRRGGQAAWVGSKAITQMRHRVFLL